MEPKIINQEVETLTTIRYDDGSTKITKDIKTYINEIDLPAFVYTKVEYRDTNGKIDEDKSFSFRETLCINDNETSQEKYTESESESESKDSQC